MDDTTALAERVCALGLDHGLDAVGVAGATRFDAAEDDLRRRKAEGLHGGMQFTYRRPARSADPAQTLPGARALVVGARSYRRHEPADADAGADADDVRPKGAVARYSWLDHYAPLRSGLDAMAEALAAEGWRTKVLVDDNALVDREAAFRAGLGWYGKNTMLLLHGRGSEFLLGSVVTDAPLPPSAPAGVDGTKADAAAAGCGTCSRCLPACPTGALVAPGVLDGRRCLAWLVQAVGVFPRQHRVALGDRIYGCDECQDVCPPNRLEIRRRPPPAAEPGSEATIDLLHLLETADDEELVQRHGRWYIPRREGRYLRRNALVALGNVGDGGDPRTARVLEDHLIHADPIVRAHAVWAAARLGRGDLVAAVASGERDPMVIDELGALPPPRQA